MSTVSRNWKLSAIKQRFSLPEALVFYITKNSLFSSADGEFFVYHKLIICCKYFWLKNPVIILNGLDYYKFNKYWSTQDINGFQDFHKLKIENLNQKLWIHSYLTVCDDQNLSLASSLIPKIYRCDLNDLWLSHQTVSFDEFKKFVSSGSLKSLDLNETTVKNDDGSIVPIEKLIELSPKLQNFNYENVLTEDGLQTVTSETAANLVAIPHFHKIQHFTITEIPESFNIDEFFAIPNVSTSMFNQ